MAVSCDRLIVKFDARADPDEIAPISVRTTDGRRGARQEAIVSF
jgi:hypothetical protein